MSGVWIRRTPIAEPLSSSSTSSIGGESTNKISPTSSSSNQEGDSSINPKIMSIGHYYKDGSIKLGLFVLKDDFQTTVGSIVILRVFEPRYQLLVRNCIKNETPFGIQAGLTKNEGGYVVSINRHRNTKEGHIVMQGRVIGKYRPIDKDTLPIEEPETYGLSWLRSTLILEKDMNPTSKPKLEEEEEEQNLSFKKNDNPKNSTTPQNNS